MGGSGSGRKPDVLNMAQRQAEQRQPIAPEIFLPNLGGVKEEALKRSDVDITGGGAAETDPVFLALSGSFITSETDPIFLALSGSFFTASSDVDHDATTNFVANKHLDWTTDLGATNIHAGNYTDTNTQLSDAEVGAYGYTKDTEVDWTVSQAPAVVHAANYTDTGDTTDHTALSNIGTQTHAQLETAIGLNTAKNTNVTTNLSLGTGNATTEVIACSDGTDCTLVEADTSNAGLLGADKWDEIVANTTHKSSNGSEHADVASNTTHRNDNTQAHSDYLLNNANDSSSGTITAAGFTTTGVILTGDHGTAATDQVVNVCYGTGDPPAANTTTEGALFVKYTA